MTSGLPVDELGNPRSNLCSWSFHIIPAESAESVEPENVLTGAESKAEITRFRSFKFGIGV